jgi:hypothetical protein
VLDGHTRLWGKTMLTSIKVRIKCYPFVVNFSEFSFVCFFRNCFPFAKFTYPTIKVSSK